MLRVALLLSPLLASSGFAAKLYASHYVGNVTILDFENNQLKQAASIKACGQMPAWLTYASSSGTLYCSDEGQGSISQVKVSADTTGLTESGRATAPGGGVANTLYGGSNGSGYIAVAHYQTSQLSTFQLPITSSSQPLQTFKFTMSAPGPNPSRQDAPHPHHVLTDPTGGFLLAPDLGADIVRLYSIDSTSGRLTECPGLAVTKGLGPRHAAFWTPPQTSSRIVRGSRSRRAPTGVVLYVLNELANSLTAYTVTYPSSGCISFAKTQELNPYPNNAAAPRGAKAGEIHVFGNSLYTSNRNDKSFSGNDSIATWSLSATNGALTFQGLTSSYGTYPRTFSINKAGDFVAIGDQTTSNVAIVRRDTQTGALGQLVSNLRIGPAGYPEREDGLSAVVWSD